MHNTYGALKYQLSYFLKFTGILMLVILGNLTAISIVMFFVKGAETGTDFVTGQIDAQTYAMILVLGLICFRPSFKFLLANGFSRKRFYWANVAALTITAAAWTGIVVLVAAAYRALVPYKLLYELLYKGTAGAPVWMFAEFLLAAMLGWCINMLYYHSNTLRKVVISILPFALLGLFVFIDARSGFTISKGLGCFFKTVMGFGTVRPNPYVGALSMLILAVLLGACNYLLVRRMQIKD